MLILMLLDNIRQAMEERFIHDPKAPSMVST